MKIYISGPMSGILKKNYPAFEIAASNLRRRGYTVISPNESDKEAKGDKWSDFLRKDIIFLAGCDSLVLLDGWENSPGALFEVMIAFFLCMPICKISHGPNQYLIKIAQRKE